MAKTSTPPLKELRAWMTKERAWYRQHKAPSVTAGPDPDWSLAAQQAAYVLSEAIRELDRLARPSGRPQRKP